jgi:hypothetical protein
MNFSLKRYRDRAIVAGALFMLWRFTNGYFLHEDGAGYFAYLPALILKGQINFSDCFRELGRGHLWITDTGLVMDPWSCGPAMLWSPFFIIGLGALKLFHIALYPPCRFALFYFTNAATLFYSGLTVAMSLAILRKLGMTRGRGWLTAAVVIGTPFLYYASYGAAMSHGISAFTVCLFAYLCLGSSQPVDGISATLSLGLAAGLMVVTRPETSAYLTLAWLPFSAQPPERRGRFLAVLIAGAALAIMPQLIMWKVLFGKLLAFPTAYNIGAQRFVLGEVLFSSFHGLLYWNPIILLAVLGYAGAFKIAVRHFVLLCGVGLLLQFIILSGAESWPNGYSFGNRVLANSFLPILVGLACPWLVLKNRKARIVLGILYALSALWTLGLFINHSAFRLDLGFPYRPDELWQLQFSLLMHPLKACRELLVPRDVFWRGLAAVALVLSALSAAVRKAGPQRFIRFSLLTLVVIFLVLTVRAAIRTTPTEYTPQERQQLVSYRLWPDSVLIHVRFEEVRYLMRMGRKSNAQHLLDDTLQRFSSTPAWHYWETLAGGPLNAHTLSLNRLEPPAGAGPLK